MLDRLTDEPKSLWRAKQLGGPELKDYYPYIGWDATTYVIADLIDELRVSNYYFLMANADDKAKAKIEEPKPYPRPGHKQVESPKRSLDDFAGTLINLFGPGIAS